MSCTASRIFLKASCLVISFPSKYTVSSSFSSDASSLVCCDSGADITGNSDEVNAGLTVEDGLVGVHGEGWVYKAVCGEEQDCLEPKATDEGEVRRMAPDVNDVSCSSCKRGKK